MLSLSKIFPQQPVFKVFAAITVISLMAAVALQSVIPVAIPAALLLFYVAIIDFRYIFFILIASIPLSVEYQLTDSFGTDLPTEPLMIGLMGIYIIYSAKNGFVLRGSVFLKHPITLLVLLTFVWAVVATINSLDTYISLKYLFAKIWYIVTFYFLGSLMLRRKSDFKRFFWCVFIPLSIAVIITTFRHAMTDFSFKDVNYVMQPMFRNHVSYACIISIFLPFVFLALTWIPRGSFLKWLIIGSIFLFLVAIQLSFTRAAYGAVIGAVGFYFVIKWKLTKYVVAASIIFIICFVAYITHNDKYLDYEPRYEKAISHENFDNLLSATARGEDISTMERVYRWVAGFQMVGKRPLTGFGPNNFFNSYKSYTVTNFKTYVSDNTEGSTVHCYYLLMAIEQGIPGMLLFFTLIFTVLLRGERIYHQAREKWQQHVTMAALLSMTIILILILINDLIETDKVGSFFYMNLAILVNMDLKNNKLFSGN